jgi:mRNA interferase MazF
MPGKSYIPRRGDIVWTTFDPSVGHEQARVRPALVLSPEIFNRNIGLALVAPITSRVRGGGFEVVLAKASVAGVVLCQQVRTIDFVARDVRFVERAHPAILDEALTKVRLLLD